MSQKNGMCQKIIVHKIVRASCFNYLKNGFIFCKLLRKAHNNFLNDKKNCDVVIGKKFATVDPRQQENLV